MTWEKVGSWNSSSFVNVEVGINYPTKYQSRIIWSQLRLNQTYCQLSSNKTLHPPPPPNGFPSIFPSITPPPYLPKLLSILFKQLSHKSTFLTSNLLSLIPNPLSRLSILLPTYSPLFPTLPTSNLIPTYQPYIQPTPPFIYLTSNLIDLFPTHSHVCLLPTNSPSTNLPSNHLLHLPSLLPTYSPLFPTHSHVCLLSINSHIYLP